MPTVGSTVMLDRLGPKRSDAEFLKSKLEAPGARFLVLADLKPVIRSNAQRTEAKLAWFSHAELTEFGLPSAEALFLGIDKALERTFRPGGHRAPHPARAGRHREAASHRRPALARHAGDHVAGGAVAVRPGARARPVARERPLLRPLRRHHAGEGRRLAAKVLGLRLGVVPAHRSGGDHADHGRPALPAGARASLRRQDVLRRSPASSSPARTSSTPCAARCSRRPASRWARSSSTRASRGPSRTRSCWAASARPRRPSS